MSIATNANTVSVEINGILLEIAEGSTILDAAKSAGIHVPTLCYYPRLPTHAVCRMCLVMVDGEAKPACKTPVAAGQVIETDSPDLTDFRQTDAQWLLARHPNSCMQCEVSGSCQLQSLVKEYQWQDTWQNIPRGSIKHPEHHLTDHTSPSIWRDLDKCIECGLCVEACGEHGQQLNIIGFAERSSERLPVTVFDKPLAETDCISCGQCTLVCPVGALIETPHWHEVLHTLDSKRRVSAVQVAPASRIAISEEFGLAPGTISTGRMINALRQLGFDYVFDTNFAADLTIMEEATELLGRINDKSRLPLFTSCCPSWVNWIEIHRPDLINNLSTTKSPQQMHGALTKRSDFVKSLGEEFSTGSKEPYVVSVMPCTSKKDESRRPGQSEDVDHVVTTRELARMIKARGIAFASLPDDGEFDNPLGASTGAGQIFGASGGVMEAVLRSTAHFIGQNHKLPLEWQQLRGVNEKIKTAEINGVGRVAICNGIAAAQQLLVDEQWRDEFVAIEVMACVGGCLGGGGEPKSMDRDVLQKRMQSIYAIDKNLERRRSHENTDVQALYDTQLGKPNSATAKKLLHTTFAQRNTDRLLLMRFLDAVDKRDDSAINSLFHPDATWNTASPLGTITGIEEITCLIRYKLPPREYGAQFKQHRMASASDINSMHVITPSGEQCRFDLESIIIEVDGSPRRVIKQITRTVLSGAG
ncbi:MAG: [FeFe] hydrogenase, group A [Kangiellaceae bacterium]|nr:[FeFe] hydrogenase, group A [Kangiellaceae bacterium]